VQLQSLFALVNQINYRSIPTIDLAFGKQTCTMTQDPATPSSPLKSSEKEPATLSSPKPAADPPTVEASHYNPQLALTTPAKENTFGGKLKDAGSWMKDYGTALKHGS
jgi:hypothetical protein